MFLLVNDKFLPLIVPLAYPTENKKTKKNNAQTIVFEKVHVVILEKLDEDSVKAECGNGKIYSS